MSIQYFKSENVKVYPCANRGINKNGTIINPNSRLNLEQNIVLPKAVGNTSNSSYLISADTTATNDIIIRVILGGYYFEITLTGDEKSLYAPNINTDTDTNTSFIIGIKTEEIASYLSLVSLEGPSANLDTTLETSDSQDYYFTGLGYTTDPADLVDGEGHEIFSAQLNLNLHTAKAVVSTDLIKDFNGTNDKFLAEQLTTSTVDAQQINTTKLTTASGQKGVNCAIDLRNSNIFGANQLRFADQTDTAEEGLLWPQADGTDKFGALYIGSVKTGLVYKKDVQLNSGSGHISTSETVFNVNTDGIVTAKEFTGELTTDSIYTNVNRPVWVSQEHGGTVNNKLAGYDNDFTYNPSTKTLEAQIIASKYITLSNTNELNFTSIVNSDTFIGLRQSNTENTNKNNRYHFMRGSGSYLDYTNDYANIKIAYPVEDTDAATQAYVKDRESVLQTQINTKAAKQNITAATKTKITYNSEGIITAGATLEASDIPSLSTDKLTSGILPINRGGTGKDSLNEAANSLINSLTTGDSVPAGDDYYIAQYAGGGSSTSSYHRRPVSKLYNYIKTKIDSDGVAKASNYNSSGTIATKFSEIEGRLTSLGFNQSSVSSIISPEKGTAVTDANTVKKSGKLAILSFKVHTTEYNSSTGASQNYYYPPVGNTTVQVSKILCTLPQNYRPANNITTSIISQQTVISNGTTLVRELPWTCTISTDGKIVASGSISGGDRVGCFLTGFSLLNFGYQILP